MAKPISPEDAAAYIDRWRLVEERERRELREASLDEKLRQVEALAASVDAFGWGEALAAEDERV